MFTLTQTILQCDEQRARVRLQFDVYVTGLLRANPISLVYLHQPDHENTQLVGDAKKLTVRVMLGYKN